jgi:hypothetical protein
MRARLTVLGAVLLVSGCGGSGTTTTTTKPPPPPPPPPSGPPPPATVTAGQVKATLYAPTSTPKANVRWPYRVVVTNTKGRKLAGKITVEIVDPLGQAHAATYDDTTKPITNLPFRGQFRDYVEWPTDSRGYTLTFRVIAKTPKGTATITYPVKAK